MLAARDTRDACEAVFREAGAQAHDSGLSWAALANILGLAGGGSAHFLFGPGREDRLARHRQRAEQRAVRQPAVEMPPGISVEVAASRLGVSPTTVRRRIQAGSLRASVVTSAGGRTKLLVDERDAPAARA